MGHGLLRGQVALVTGAGSGIGAGIAREYAGEEATVIILDRDAEGARRTEREIEARGGSARAYPLDVADYDRYAAVVSEVIQRFGHLDTLVNNAATAHYSTVRDVNLHDWRDTLRINLEAVYLGSALVVPHMINQGKGTIISISSIQAFASSGDADSYGASKAGIIGLTKSMAVGLARHNILVNAIAPGFIRTPMSIVNGVDETETEEFRDRYLANRRIPLGRVGEPRDIAGTAVFLASDYCRYLTGQVLIVDGGLTSTF